MSKGKGPAKSQGKGVSQGMSKGSGKGKGKANSHAISQVTSQVISQVPGSTRIARQDDEVQLRPAAPRSGGGGRRAKTTDTDRFVSRVAARTAQLSWHSASQGLGRTLSALSGAARGQNDGPGPGQGSGHCRGQGRGRKAGRQPGSRIGRGHTAAQFARSQVHPSSRRVAVKVLLVNLKKSSSRTVADHFSYISREGVGRGEEAGQPYGAVTDQPDLGEFEARTSADRHIFRFTIAPENGEQLGDLKTFTRHFMSQMEADLGTGLEWVAVDHWDTDQPHTHVVLRGKDDTGGDLVMARDYIAHGMRARAALLATAWLGPRSELDLAQARQREITQERWTSLDEDLHALAAQSEDGHVSLRALDEPQLAARRGALIGRLQHLQGMGLAEEGSPGGWRLSPGSQGILTAMAERHDVIRTLQRAMGGHAADLVEFRSEDHPHPLVGRLAFKGVADELRDRCFVIVDGVDGRSHYLKLGEHTDARQLPLGSIVEVRGADSGAALDQAIAAQAVNGIYRSPVLPEHDPSRAAESGGPGLSRQLMARTWRLEVLQRAGIVTRVESHVEGGVEGGVQAALWAVPADLEEQGRQLDARRQCDVTVALRTHLPIEAQARAMGATWLDHTLIRGAPGIVPVGFGAQVRQALAQRMEFLVEQELAQRQGRKVVLARDLLSTLRERDLARAGGEISEQTGLVYQPATEAQKVTGVLRKRVDLASGRFAMLDDGVGFYLVPWKPMLDASLGQPMSATSLGWSASWHLGAKRGPAID